MTEPQRQPAAPPAADAGAPPSVLADCRPDHFDGHTEFGRMTPDQRLNWLARAVRFVTDHARRHRRNP